MEVFLLLHQQAKAIAKMYNLHILSETVLRGYVTKFSPHHHPLHISTMVTWVTNRNAIWDDMYLK